MTVLFNPATQKNEISSTYFLTELDRHNMRWTTFVMFLLTVLSSIITYYWYGWWGAGINFALTFPCLRDMGHKWVFYQIKRRTGHEEIVDPFKQK